MEEEPEPLTCTIQVAGDGRVNVSGQCRGVFEKLMAVAEPPAAPVELPITQVTVEGAVPYESRRRRR